MRKNLTAWSNYELWLNITHSKIREVLANDNVGKVLQESLVEHRTQKDLLRKITLLFSQSKTSMKHSNNGLNQITGR